MIALFGKLPARRDFVARDVPGPVLERSEPWLQEAMAQSRETLGRAWGEAYLNAPIWRFWWSRRLTGAGAVGALMPSVDAMGRYFPLLALALAPQDRDFALPTEAGSPWYLALEEAMLAALSEEASLEVLLSRLGALPAPPEIAAATSHRHADLDGSLWWTYPTPQTPAQRAAWPGFPPPSAFSGMLAPDEGAAKATLK